MDILFLTLFFLILKFFFLMGSRSLLKDEAPPLDVERNFALELDRDQLATIVDLVLRLGPSTLP